MSFYRWLLLFFSIWLCDIFSKTVLKKKNDNANWNKGKIFKRHFFHWKTKKREKRDEKKKIWFIFRRVNASQEPAMSVGCSVGKSIGSSLFRVFPLGFIVTGASESMLSPECPIGLFALGSMMKIFFLSSSIHKLPSNDCFKIKLDSAFLCKIGFCSEFRH